MILNSILQVGVMLLTISKGFLGTSSQALAHSPELPHSLVAFFFGGLCFGIALVCSFGLEKKVTAAFGLVSACFFFYRKHRLGREFVCDGERSPSFARCTQYHAPAQRCIVDWERLLHLSRRMSSGIRILHFSAKRDELFSRDYQHAVLQ